MSEIALDIEESITAAAANPVLHHKTIYKNGSAIPLHGEIGPTATVLVQNGSRSSSQVVVPDARVEETDALLLGSASDNPSTILAPSSNGFGLGSSSGEEEPLTPGTVVVAIGGGGDEPIVTTDDELLGGPNKTTTTIIHHHQPIYANYCFCCPSQTSTKKSKLYFTISACVLSLICGIFLSVAFFYPEQLFGVQSDNNNNRLGGSGSSNAYSGKMIHHPHQNRAVLHSSSLSSSSSSGGVKRGGGRASSASADKAKLTATANGNGGGGDEDDDDDEPFDDTVSVMFGNSPFPTLNKGGGGEGGGRAAAAGQGGGGGSLLLQQQTSSTNTFRKILTFNELTQTFNYSNVIQNRLLHFDMKGAPPTVSYMKEIIRLGKEAGITGLLLEWEDTFPWKGALTNTTLADEAGFTEDQIIEILDYAEIHLGLEVIPLIQTFGHVEYILKSSEFLHLREDPNDPQSFCPSLKETLQLIEEMIRQIVALHKNSKFIHIGCDEVFNIGICPLCSANSDRRTTTFDPNEVLFLKHVTSVGELVKKTGRIPIIWDDMLRSISYEKLNEYSLGTIVEPMVWVYAEDIDKFISGEQWSKYTKIFSTIWVAGSFKGAFGESLQIPPIVRHAENTQNWLEVIGRESNGWDYGIGGFVLTGWSRYDHFSVLCELLPVAIPSLIYTSLVLSVPGGGSRIIKNRVFVPINPYLSSTTTTTTTTDKNSIDIFIEPPLSAASASRKKRRRRRSTTGKKWIPHPQSLRINAAPISTFSGSTNENNAFLGANRAQQQGSSGSGSGSSSSLWKNHQAMMIDKYLHINSEFSRILHCSSYDKPIVEFQLPSLVQDEESGLVSRCSFQGVTYFRSLLRLRILLNEIWNLDTSLLRNRGWVTRFSQRHNYSSPHRVDDLVFNQVARLKRNLVQLSKSVGLALKKLVGAPTILEWLELHVWDAWLTLDGWERVGDELKATKSWPRRPLKTPEKMISDLGLLPLQLYDKSDEYGRDEL